jgi:hypothetical protein
LVLRATAIAVEVVVPVMDIVGAVVHINLWAGGSAPAADSYPPAEEVLMTATNPH